MARLSHKRISTRRHEVHQEQLVTGFNQRERSAATTRKLRILRAHGLIKKVPKTHRYLLTDRGREFITTVLAARSANAEALMKAA
jgi:predicted transcriptional regulator